MGRARSGMNLIEVLVAAVVAGIVMLGLGSFITRNVMVSGTERDATFAQQKAVQMLEEISAMKLSGPNDPGPDRFSAEGVRFELTTAGGVLPHDSLSANPRVGSAYKYVRRILSEPVTGDPYARKVTVQVWYADDSATPTLEGSKPLAAVTGVLRSNIAAAGPKQVIPVYAVSIENLPHVYRKDDDNQYYPSASAARAQFESSLRKVEASNPWLTFDVQYISRLSIGRDQHYQPYINESGHLHGSGRDDLDWAYFYPGKLESAADSGRYYDATAIAGNIKNDASIVRDSYPLADQFNHAVQYAREFDDQGRPLKPDGTIATEPKDMSLRQFLETLLNAPPESRYRNGVVVNLHGELFPALPLRNYADAAKDLSDLNVAKARRRLVTHPYQLSFQPGVEPVRLLVHPFRDDGQITPSPGDSSDNSRHVKVNWNGTDYSREAKIIIKGIAPFLMDAPEYGDTGGTGVTNRSDVMIDVIQRQKFNPGSANNDKTIYVRKNNWPVARESRADIGEYAGGTRNPHSGPHAKYHGDDTSHHYEVAAGLHGQDPVLVGNDLVITLTDLDFDARLVDNSGTKYGIEGSGTNKDYVLHQLQYFPDPFLPLLDVANGGNKPRNTARVVIEFKLHPTTPIGKRFEVVTQLKKATGGYLDPDSTDADVANDLSISRSYFYAGPAFDTTRKLYWDAVNDRPAIPWTDQVQLLGDPRHNPYYDARKHGLFNPYFSEWGYDDELYKDITNKPDDSSKNLQAATNAFPFSNSTYTPTTPLLVPTATSGQWDLRFQGSAKSYAEVKYNVPEYFRMWRHALLRNHMVFLNPTGEPMRLLGLGGEFSMHKRVNGIGDLHISKQPYDGNEGSDADGDSDELFGDRTPIIEQADDSWYSKAWIGELYPSNKFQAWTLNNNLRSESGEFRRRPLDAINEWSKFTNAEKGHHRKRLKDRVGFAAFLNGTSSVGGTPVKVEDSGGDNASLSTTGVTLGNTLKLTLPSGAKAKYSYKLEDGNEPPAWSSAPYDVHGKVEWLLSSAATPPGYFKHPKGTDYYANSPILLTDDHTTPTRAAVVVANTLRAENASAVGSLMDMATAAMTEAFFDGTRQAIGAYNIKPLPRVRLTQPRIDQLVSGAVPLEWYARWVKPDGEAFSPFFTDTFDPPPAASSGGPLPVVYLVKYRPEAGSVWKTAKLTAPSSIEVTTAPGEVVTNASVALIPNQTYPSPITATWDTVGLPNGKYVLRVEGFRSTDASDRTKTIPGYYSYYETLVVVEN